VARALDERVKNNLIAKQNYEMYRYTFKLQTFLPVNICTYKFVLFISKTLPY